MSTAAARAHAGGSILLRSVGWHPAAPILAGVGVSGLLLVVYQLMPSTGGDRFDVGRFFSVILGYYLALTPLCVRAATRSLDQLSGLSPGRLQFYRGELARLPLGWAAAFTGVFMAMHLAILIGRGAPLDPLVGFRILPSRIGFTFILGWIHILAAGLFTALLLRQALLFRRLGRELPELDLLDHEPVAPLVRIASQLTLVFALAIALAVLLHVDWSGDRSVAPQVLLISPMWITLGCLLFFFPLWSLHERLRDGRAAELRRVHGALRGEPGALAGSTLLRDGETLSSVELLTYRAQIESIGTWPFHASALIRLALYLGIPLASWVGGALVERVLDTVLG